MKHVMSAIVLGYLALLGFTSGYLVGHNEGFDIGKHVGHVECSLKPGSCVLHATGYVPGLHK